MPFIRVELDPESFERLAALAVAERRPLPWQAEILLLRALAVPAEPVTAPSQRTAGEVQYAIK